MEIRELKNGIKSSLFGLGCMRLPMNKENSAIDENEAIKMIREAIDSGVTYIDTAYNYHNNQSEIVVGKALKNGYREKVNLATKLPAWHVKTEEDLSKLLNEQLEKLQTSYIDFYLLHSLTKSHWETLKNVNIFKFMEQAKKEGKIKNICFSFHDDLEFFKELIDLYDWDMCQIQLNFFDEDYQAGLKGLKYAASKGIPVVVMEPLKGGLLSKQIPDEITELYNHYKTKKSPVEWAFKWLTNFPEVTVILSGTSTIEQMRDNIRIFSDAKPNSLTSEDLKLFEKIKQKYTEKIVIGCTACRYCMPCPQGVDIPAVFGTYNQAFMFNKEDSIQSYNFLKSSNRQASQCIACGKCEPKCPQNIKIIEKLKEAEAFLTK